MAEDPITEAWLAEAGFRWSQIERQPSKHWLLWMGQAAAPERQLVSPEDLGVEIAEGLPGDSWWHCWIRADYCGRYSRFIHVRHLRHVFHVFRLIEGLIGYPFDPANVAYGVLRSPEAAAKFREYERRMDVTLAREWGGRVEKETGADPTKREVLRP